MIMFPTYLKHHIYILLEGYSTNNTPLVFSSKCRNADCRSVQQATSLHLTNPRHPPAHTATCSSWYELVWSDTFAHTMSPDGKKQKRADVMVVFTSEGQFILSVSNKCFRFPLLILQLLFGAQSDPELYNYQYKNNKTKKDPVLTLSWARPLSGRKTPKVYSYFVFWRWSATRLFAARSSKGSLSVGSKSRRVNGPCTDCCSSVIKLVRSCDCNSSFICSNLVLLLSVTKTSHKFTKHLTFCIDFILWATRQNFSVRTYINYSIIFKLMQSANH